MKPTDMILSALRTTPFGWATYADLATATDLSRQTITRTARQLASCGVARTGRLISQTGAAGRRQAVLALPHINDADAPELDLDPLRTADPTTQPYAPTPFGDVLVQEYITATATVIAAEVIKIILPALHTTPTTPTENPLTVTSDTAPAPEPLTPEQAWERALETVRAETPE